MQALIQGVASLVAAMACTAFAHFGVALKAPCHASAHSARRLPVSTAAAPLKAGHARMMANQRRI